MRNKYKKLRDLMYLNMEIHQNESGLKYKLLLLFFVFTVYSKLEFGKSAIKFPFSPLDKALM